MHIPSLLTAIILGISGVTANANANVGTGEMGGMGIEMDMAGRLMPRQKGGSAVNLQTFTGALGGVAAEAVTNSGDSSRPFKVGGDTFTDFKSAGTRSCNNQHNKCAQVANSNGGKGGLSVSDCDEQQTSCISAVSSSTATAFPTLFSSDAQFDYFCDP